MAAETLPRRVDLNYLEWLAEPGLYSVPSIGTSDVARLRRHAKKVGTTVNSSRDNGRVLIEIRKA